MKILLLLALLLAACNPRKIELQGAGASFPYPLYSKMFEEYYKEFNVGINYQAIGSGGGIRQLLAKTVDFGASDVFMSDKELKESPNILHIPICLGAVVITYNLPGNPKIKLTPDVIADIFLGKIKKWNDKRIKEINPDIALPNKDIIVIRRSDASGTTFIFTDYLSKISKDWEKNIGKGSMVNWKIGLGGKGNAGVTSLIKQTNGAIGYIELTYAMEQNLPYAVIKNKKGNFIEPCISSVSLAGDIEIPDDTRTSIVDTDNPFGYSISGFTWILVYKEQGEEKKGKELAKLLWWMTHKGQEYTKPLHYASLPTLVVKKAEVIISLISYNGRPLLKKGANF
ncbi:MAG: phosphate ABC transporter substrate-binding protein PstS [bacterium]